jgi:Erv1 / Alr family
MNYTDDIWNFLHMLSLVIIPKSKPDDLEKRLQTFHEFFIMVHSIYSSIPFPSNPFVQSILSCKEPIQLFEWVYNVRKLLFKHIPHIDKVLEYYRPVNKMEPISALITKDVWGPYTWRFIHTLALHTNQLSILPKLLPLLFFILPCPICREHAHTFIKEHPINITTNYEAFSWTILFHNNVSSRINDTIGSRKKPYSVEDAIVLYS